MLGTGFSDIDSLNAKRVIGRITDFGFARRMDGEGRYVAPNQSHNLPVRITAPESLATTAAEYSIKSDVWSLGVLLYSLCARKRTLSGGQETEGSDFADVLAGIQALMARFPMPK